MLKQDKIMSMTISKDKVFYQAQLQMSIINH